MKLQLSGDTIVVELSEGQRLEIEQAGGMGSWARVTIEQLPSVIKTERLPKRWAGITPEMEQK